LFNKSIILRADFREIVSWNSQDILLMKPNTLIALHVTLSIWARGQGDGGKVKSRSQISVSTGGRLESFKV